MYVCSYVYMYVGVCIYMYTCITHIHMHIHPYICVGGVLFFYPKVHWEKNLSVLEYQRIGKVKAVTKSRGNCVIWYISWSQLHFLLKYC